MLEINNLDRKIMWRIKNFINGTPAEKFIRYKNTYWEDAVIFWYDNNKPQKNTNGPPKIEQKTTEVGRRTEKTHRWFAEETWRTPEENRWTPEGPWKSYEEPQKDPGMSPEDPQKGLQKPLMYPQRAPEKRLKNIRRISVLLLKTFW